MHDLGTLGGNFSTAQAINSKGQVGGHSEIHPPPPEDEEEHAFRYDSKSLQDLGTLRGGNAANAFGIDEEGTVVVGSLTFDDEEHAFISSHGALRDLNELIPSDSGWTLVEAEAIRGAIVGVGETVVSCMRF